MRVILDTGALIALEHRPAALIGLLDGLADQGSDVPVVPTTVLAQAWRGGTSRQAPMAKWLSSCDYKALDEARAREVGELLAAAGRADIVDAHVVVCANPGDVIVTTDPRDIATLVIAGGRATGIVAL